MENQNLAINLMHMLLRNAVPTAAPTPAAIEIMPPTGAAVEVPEAVAAPAVAMESEKSRDEEVPNDLLRTHIPTKVDARAAYLPLIANSANIYKFCMCLVSSQKCQISTRRARRIFSDS